MSFVQGALLKIVWTAVTTDVSQLLAFVHMRHSPRRLVERLPFDKVSQRWIASGSFNLPNPSDEVHTISTSEDLIALQS